MAPDEISAPRRLGVAAGQMAIDAAVRAAQKAERLGFERVLLGEHGLDGDPFLGSAAVLEATRSILCGPAIVHVIDRHPVVLARSLATLNVSHPGRIFAGLGRSDPEFMVDQLGLSMGGGSAALADTVSIARVVLGGAAIDHQGSYWSARLNPAPPYSRAEQRVPLMLAAVGPRTLRLAGAIADGAILNFGASPSYVELAVAEIASGAQAVGRDPAEIDILCFVLVARQDGGAGPTPASQLAAIRATLDWMFAMPDQGKALADPAGGRPRNDSAAELGRFAAIGDRAQCLAYIDAIAAAGANCTVLLAAGMNALFPGQ